MQTQSEQAAAQTGRSVFRNYDRTDTEGDSTLEQADAPSFQKSTATLQEQIDTAMARAFIYRFLAKAYENPAKKGWKWLCSVEVKRLLEVAICTLAPNESNSLAGAMKRFIGKLALKDFDEVECNYLNAFGHTVRGDCPMNEIEYGDIKADPLFQPHRLADLAAFYSAFGLEITSDAAERQDHICLELEFMSVLAMKEVYALENQFDAEQLAVCRDAQRKFLHEHLARWTPAFTRRLAKIVGESPLGAIADFTHLFIVLESQRVGITPGSEDLMLRPIDESGERLCDSCGIHNLPPGALRST